ncbi:MAG: hypothetical protein K2O81_02285, partial [Clostridia bacterium]|nr:hypothetical protein [Clostridia bacterium]
AVTVADLAAKGNLEDGDADIKIKLNSQIFGDGSVAAQSGYLDYNVYLRGFNVFYMTEPAAETYEYMDLNASDTADTAAADMLATMLAGSLNDYSMLLKLANTTDSIIVSETEHTITLNINQMVYGLYGYIKQIVNNITTDTTLGGLIKCSAIKYYINAYAGEMTAQDLYDTVMQIIVGNIGGGESGTTPFADVPENSLVAAIIPLQGESVYDYIVRMLNSEDVATLVGSEKPLGAYKISEWLGEDAAAALKSLKDAVNALDGTVISRNKITVPAQGGTQSADSEVSISDLSLVFTFDAQDDLKTVNLSGVVGADMDGEVEMELNLTVTLLGQKVTGLDEIGAYTVNVRDDYGDILGTTTVESILTPDTAE